MVKCLVVRVTKSLFFGVSNLTCRYPAPLRRELHREKQKLKKKDGRTEAHAQKERQSRCAIKRKRKKKSRAATEFNLQELLNGPG